MSTPDHLDDEQLTALQDGVGAAADRAHVDGCERCRDRADRLAGVAALVATPPPPPSAAARDAAVATALSEADRPVVAFGDRRRLPEWLAPVAAVVVLLALVVAIVPLLGRAGDDDDDSAASGRTATAESQDTAGGGGGGSSGDDAQRSAAPSGATDLGVVDDEADLARRVDSVLTAEASADIAGDALRDEDRCAASFRSLSPPLGALRLRAALVWQGAPAEVLSDGEQAVVLAAGECTVLATVPLP